MLDFTQLNNQAAEGLKRQAQPVINLIGNKNLCALVNKVDRRRKGDMTSEHVKAPLRNYHKTMGRKGWQTKEKYQHHEVHQG